MGKPDYTFKIKCPECEFKETDEEHFINTTVYCEDCGEHSAIGCPQCEERFDHVWMGDVCSICGLVLGGFDKCPQHPDSPKLEWLTLGRGS